MLKLADKYADRPPAELPLLFQRILQNTIRDYYRRQKVRSTWTTLLSALTPGGSKTHESRDAPDPLDTMVIEQAGMEAPDIHLERTQVIDMIEMEIAKLPPRQRQAFLMRYWEGMNIAETASIMGCTEGSVKTHCSRATQSLAAALRSKGITP